MRQESRTRQTILWYRGAYGENEQTRWAFARLIESGGLFKRIETDEQKAAHNYIVTLLENMGFTQGINYDKLAEAFFNLGIPEEAIDGN